MQAFNWPEVRTRVTVDGVVAVIDGAGRRRRAASPTIRQAVDAQRAADPSLDHESPLDELFEDQLVCADLVVLNKADLLGDADRAQGRSAIRRHRAAGAKMIAAEHRRDRSGASCLGSAPRPRTISARGASHHDARRRSTITTTSKASPSTCRAGGRSRQLLARLHGASIAHDILRVKGFLDVPGKAMRLVLQGVGARLQHYYDRPWRSDEPRAGHLVVIGLKGLDRAAITSRRYRLKPAHMHLLAAKPGTISDGREAVDLGQTPGDIVYLSAADTRTGLPGAGASAARR